MHQAVEQVPVQLAVLAVVPAPDLVAAFVVVVVGAGVFAQQVVAFGVVVQRALVLLGFFIQQVAGRVEGEGFHAQAAGGAEQAAYRVVAVGEGAASTVVEVGQLACGIVLIVVFEQCGFAIYELVF